MQPAPPPDIRALVDQILLDALQRRASDVHWEPAAASFDLRFRIDGALQTIQQIEISTARAMVVRLMVMAKLLTYRLEVPQEGRISIMAPQTNQSVELRLAVMPTIHGMRAAVRMPADQVQAAVLEELGLPGPVFEGLLRFAGAEAGMLILTGPAGSGKTTTIYALLRRIVQAERGISVIALEDPVERNLAGVTQIEVSPFGQLTYERALRSILRQDPQVLMLGEIRDAATASLAVQAALSGHRLITTFHAATPGGAIARLLEMGIEPYQLTSSIYGVVSQRLVRRKNPQGGTLGRVPIAEFVSMDSALRNAVLTHSDADSLHEVYRSQPGHQSLADAARAMVEAGIADPADVQPIIASSGPTEP
ncbi:MAG: Flp pilus assembly complex ATPase component TadA [Planctomycetota bacterium]|nr:Flp pilus assembly complex ATPase component TadA [Planctomycetota bacterium]